jgi:hypothetical protein
VTTNPFVQLLIVVGLGGTLEREVHAVLGVEGQRLLGAVDILGPFRTVSIRELELGQN